jgi:methylmalonyl-CoA mutase C-terminal domain/subunit
MPLDRPRRILLAKPGLDGHDRGVKVVAMGLRDAGFDVIYLGLRQTPESIMSAADQEDVDAIGVSILSGVHVSICQRLIELRRERQRDDVPIFVGGTIPQNDEKVLRELGVAEVFPVGTDIDDVIARVRTILSVRQESP